MTLQNYDIDKSINIFINVSAARWYKCCLFEGEPVRIFVYSDTVVCRSVCPALFSFKKILFGVVLLAPVLGMWTS